MKYEHKSYNDGHKRCLYYELVIALAIIINDAPRVVSCAPRAMLQIVTPFYDCHDDCDMYIVEAADLVMLIFVEDIFWVIIAIYWKKLAADFPNFEVIND